MDVSDSLQIARGMMSGLLLTFVDYRNVKLNGFSQRKWLGVSWGVIHGVF